ncbi:hypothetical protein Tco_0626060 [Tanacetum coccineum]|uniref:Uncharacterized protein n=1 Tax=Tanacetum coccineum TaxID=301880 RepID=A0ABQ4WIK4_9ASTR
MGTMASFIDLQLILRLTISPNVSSLYDTLSLRSVDCFCRIARSVLGLYNATYSASAEDIAVQFCFFDIQLTSLSPRNYSSSKGTEGNSNHVVTDSVFLLKLAVATASAKMIMDSLEAESIAFEQPKPEYGSIFRPRHSVQVFEESDLSGSLMLQCLRCCYRSLDEKVYRAITMLVLVDALAMILIGVDEVVFEEILLCIEIRYTITCLNPLWLPAFLAIVSKSLAVNALYSHLVAIRNATVLLSPTQLSSKVVVGRFVQLLKILSKEVPVFFCLSYPSNAFVSVWKKIACLMVYSMFEDFACLYGRMFSAASSAAMSIIGGRSFEPAAIILLCIWLSVEDVLTGVDMLT